MITKADKDKYYSNHRNKAIRIIFEAKKNGCVLCGYNKCSNALDFHHINPNQEKKTKNSHSFKDLRIKTLITEIKKCIVVCANCHREIHAGQVIGYEFNREIAVHNTIQDELPILKLCQ